MKITTFNNLDEITGNEGKILLYDEAKSKIGASTETVNDIIQDQVGSEISRLDGRVDTVESNVDALNSAIALKADTDKVYTKTEVDEKFADFGGFEVVEGDSETGEPVVENPDVKKIYLVKKGTKKDKYCEWIWTKEEGSTENTWVLIGETTVDLTDYAKTVEVDAGLTLKEDKVFIAEYNVTPYADIKAAYDAGKQIVCKYYPNKTTFPEYVITLKLNEYVPMASVFIFAAQITAAEFAYANCNFSNTWYYEQRQFYDSTQFKGENNTITAINTSAVGQTLTAGTDLVINDGVIGVNTNGTAEGENSFVAGSNTKATSLGAAAFGLNTSAIGQGSFAEGDRTSAAGNFSHAEGNVTNAAGAASHAEGGGTSAVGAGSHAEGNGTIAGDISMHVGGQFNKTSANAAFVIGNGTSVYDEESKAVVTTLSDAFIVDWVGVASATKLATSGIQDVETTIKSKLDTSAIQFVSTSAEAVAGTQGVIYIVTGTNA